MKQIKPIYKLLIIVAVLLLFMDTFLKILGIILLLFIAKKVSEVEISTKQKQSKKRLEVQDNSYERLRLADEIAREKLQKSYEIKMATDVRQFKGRSDVTKEEVLTYILEKDLFVGFITQQIHLERIQEVCNITEEDRDWITHELWGKTKINEDKEGQKVNDYHIRQGAKKVREIEDDIVNYWDDFYKLAGNENTFSKKERDEHIRKELNDIDHLRRVYRYEDWLKEKGRTSTTTP